MYRLPQSLREELRKPLGELVRGTVEEGMAKLREVLSRSAPFKLIAVGDLATRGLSSSGLRADLTIVDHKIMRRPVEPIRVEAEVTRTVRNPPSTITEEAWSAIEEALRTGKRTHLVVEGEEDLLALPAIVLAPEGSVVIYGQPGQGLVIVAVTEERKSFCRSILRRMQWKSKS